MSTLNVKYKSHSNENTAKVCDLRPGAIVDIDGVASVILDVCVDDGLHRRLATLGDDGVFKRRTLHSDKEFRVLSKKSRITFEPIGG